MSGIMRDRSFNSLETLERVEIELAKRIVTRIRGEHERLANDRISYA